MTPAARRQFIFGILGNLTSVVLYASPLPTFWEIMNNGQVRGYSSVPYVGGLVTSLIGLLYSTMTGHHSQGWLMILVYSIGIAAEAAYVIVFVRFSPNRRMIGGITLLSYCLVGCTVPLLSLASVSTRTHILGICVAFSSSLCYASPLLSLKTVIRDTSVASMPFLLILSGLISSIMWLIYSVIGDEVIIYFLVSNSVGVVAGILLIIFYCIYFVKEKRQAIKAGMAASRIALVKMF